VGEQPAEAAREPADAQALAPALLAGGGGSLRRFVRRRWGRGGRGSRGRRWLANRRSRRRRDRRRGRDGGTRRRLLGGTRFGRGRGCCIRRGSFRGRGGRRFLARRFGRRSLGLRSLGRFRCFTRRGLMAFRERSRQLLDAEAAPAAGALGFGFVATEPADHAAVESWDGGEWRDVTTRIVVPRPG